MQMFNIEIDLIDSSGVLPPHSFEMSDIVSSSIRVWERAYHNRERYSKFGIERGHDIIVHRVYDIASTKPDSEPDIYIEALLIGA